MSDNAPRYFTDGRDFWRWDGSDVTVMSYGAWTRSIFSSISELTDCINIREINEEELP